MRHRGIGNDPEQRFFVEMCAGDAPTPPRACYLAQGDEATHYVRIVHLKVGTPLIVTIEASIDDPHAKIEFKGPADMIVSPTEWIAEITFNGQPYDEDRVIDDIVITRRNNPSRAVNGTELITARIWADRGERRRKLLRSPDVTTSFEIGLQ